MQALPQQIESSLPKNSIKTGLRVSTINKDGVLLDDGHTLAAKRIVFATNTKEVEHLSGHEETTTYLGEKYLYFAAEKLPLNTNMLLLNGEMNGEEVLFRKLELKEYFENTKGFGVMSTADNQGKVDSAVYSRPHVFEYGTIALIMRDRLTHENLKTNPHAVFLFVEEGKGYCGKRLFLIKIR